MENLSGLIAATFTPMKEDGRLDLAKIPNVVEKLISEGINGLYVCGGTGEGASLTSDERKATANAFIQAASGRVPVIVQVGHNSLFEAQQLATHAARIGASAISPITPTFFKPSSVDALVDSLAIITKGAPDLPFIYYHFPAKAGLTIDVVAMLKQCPESLPSLFGVKFTDSKLFDLQSCLEVSNGRYKLFFGIDEMLLGGLTVGAHGAIGSTYNFTAPLYQRIITAFQNGNLEAANQDQALSAKLVRTFAPYDGIEGQKAIMSLIGLDCGKCRSPMNRLSDTAISQLNSDLEGIGYFEWGMKFY